jgi:hypothetical protein
MSAMKTVATHILLVVSGCLLAGTAAADTYRWVDDNGVVHYGDSLPADSAEKQKHVLNDQGIPISKIEGRKTREQLQEEALIRAEQERAEMVAARQIARDRILLDTYLSVEEIELLRDRRLELLQAQTMVTEQYVGTLRARLKGLQTEVEDYNYPYDEESELPSLPDNLATELMQTLEATSQYEAMLQTKREEQANLVAMFDRDIERFNELKEIEEEREANRLP